jgi:hypothetical protein
MSGIHQMLLGGGGTAAQLEAASYETIRVSPNSAQVAVELRTDGDFYTVTNAVSLLRYRWLLGGAVSQFEARATTTSGTLSTGTAGTWLPLSSTQGWGVSQASVGFKSCTFTLEIRDAASLVVLASASITLSATVEI